MENHGHNFDAADRAARQFADACRRASAAIQSVVACRRDEAATLRHLDTVRLELLAALAALDRRDAATSDTEG